MEFTYEIAHLDDENIIGEMSVDTDDEARAREVAEHVLEEQYPGSEDYVLLSLEVK